MTFHKNTCSFYITSSYIYSCICIIVYFLDISIQRNLQCHNSYTSNLFHLMGDS